MPPGDAAARTGTRTFKSVQCRLRIGKFVRAPPTEVSISIEGYLMPELARSSQAPLDLVSVHPAAN